MKVYGEKGHPSKQGTGIFSAAMQEAYTAYFPMEEEGRLNDAPIRENFIERIFCYRRWKTQKSSNNRITRGTIVALSHTAQIFIAHPQPFPLSGPWAARREGRPVHPERLSSLVTAQSSWMRSKVKATVRKHVNVLQHLAGYFKKQLSTIERAELQETIQDYHRSFNSPGGSAHAH